MYSYFKVTWSSATIAKKWWPPDSYADIWNRLRMINVFVKNVARFLKLFFTNLTYHSGVSFPNIGRNAKVPKPSQFVTFVAKHSNFIHFLKYIWFRAQNRSTVGIATRDLDASLTLKGTNVFNYDCDHVCTGCQIIHVTTLPALGCRKLMPEIQFNVFFS